MTSSNGNIFCITGPLWGESTGHRWNPLAKANGAELWSLLWHDDVIKWKHIPRSWPFVRGIHRSPVNSPHKGLWRGSLMLSLICALNKRWSKQSWGWRFETPSRSLWRHCNDLRLNKLWANDRNADDLRRHPTHYDVIVMLRQISNLDMKFGTPWPSDSIWYHWPWYSLD